MLVKINKIDENGRSVNVTLLDIDEFGLVTPIRDLNLQIIPNDSLIIDLLQSSSHAIIFTQDFSRNENSVIISALNLSDDELNDEKEKLAKNNTKRTNHND